MILSVQNGIDGERQIADAVGDEPVLGAIALIAAIIESPGVVAQIGGPGGGLIKFGELAGGTSSRAERLLTVLEDAGISAVLDTDIKLALWDKFVGICAFSGVTSLTRLPIGPIMDCPETRRLYRSTLEEVVALAHAQDIALPEDTADNWIDGMSRGSRPWVTSSMHHDLKIGRRLELDILNGAASRLGKELGVPTPANDVIYAALAPYANGEPEVPAAP
jgi:2-dehydropantoate 2-reductase